MVDEKPVAAFTLSLIGLSLQAVGLVFLASAFVFWRSLGFWGQGMMMPWMMWSYWSATPVYITLFVALAALVLCLGILGVVWMNTVDIEKVRVGATLVLVSSIIAFPTMFGFLIGSLLMFIGGILGLTWHPGK
ncbi:MAG: hypothetical protein ACK4TI_01825 [Nitrososphaerales archaeon]